MSISSGQLSGHNCRLQVPTERLKPITRYIRDQENERRPIEYQIL